MRYEVSIWINALKMSKIKNVFKRYTIVIVYYITIMSLTTDSVYHL